MSVTRSLGGVRAGSSACRGMHAQYRARTPGSQAQAQDTEPCRQQPVGDPSPPADEWRSLAA